MSQTSLDNDDLFGEAATEMRDDVETSLDAAREALPAAEEIWDVESENTLGVLNALKTALDTGDAADHLRDAKKWYTMGERADAFDDADDLEAEIEAVEELIADINDAHDQIGDLTATIPQLRSQLSETPDSDAGNPEEAQA